MNASAFFVTTFIPACLNKKKKKKQRGKKNDAVIDFHVKTENRFHFCHWLICNTLSIWELGDGCFFFYPSRTQKWSKVKSARIYQIKSGFVLVCPPHPQCERVFVRQHNFDSQIDSMLISLNATFEFERERETNPFLAFTLIAKSNRSESGLRARWSTNWKVDISSIDWKACSCSISAGFYASIRRRMKKKTSKHQRNQTYDRMRSFHFRCLLFRTSKR